jgi:predicted MFS family arabinose efflux permease
MAAETESEVCPLAPGSAKGNAAGSSNKWLVVALFWCVYFLNQADRQVIFSVFPLLQREMGLSNIQLGLLGSSFQWVYACLVPVAGSLGDVLSRRDLIVVALLIWSVATFSSGFVAGFALLLVLRAATGAGEAFYYPSAASIISDYHGERTRAFAMSVHQTSVYLGIVSSGALAGYIGQAYGWRHAFVAFGVVGILAAVLVRSAIREPRRGQADANGTAAKCVKPPLPLRERLAEIFHSSTAIPLMLTFLGMNFVNVACLTWTPTMLYQKFHLSLAESGFHATAYHNLGAFLGVLLGGKLADHWASRSRLSRPLIQLAGLVLGAPFIFLLGTAESSLVVYISLGIFGVFRGIYDSNLFATLYEVIRPEARATATGVMLSVAFLGGGSASLVVGWFSQRVGLDSALASTSVFYLLSAALLLVTCIFWFRRDVERVRKAIENRSAA